MVDVLQHNLNIFKNSFKQFYMLRIMNGWKDNSHGKDRDQCTHIAKINTTLQPNTLKYNMTNYLKFLT